jgi:hypothetical protein
VRGPVAGPEQAYVLARDWLGAPPALDRDAALGWLARRYLAGHGPATDRDLAKWSGLPLGDVRRGLASIAAELAERAGGLVSLVPVRSRGPADLPPARLLGAFDPVLHGWQSRAPVLGQHERAIVQGGMFAMVRGRAVGTWGLPGGRVVLTELADLTATDRAELAADAADVTRFLGLR